MPNRDWINLTRAKLRINQQTEKGTMATSTIRNVYMKGKKALAEIKAIAFRRVQNVTKIPSIKKLLDWRFLVSPNHKRPSM